MQDLLIHASFPPALITHDTLSQRELVVSIYHHQHHSHGETTGRWHIQLRRMKKNDIHFTFVQFSSPKRCMTLVQSSLKTNLFITWLFFSSLSLPFLSLPREVNRDEGERESLWPPSILFPRQLIALLILSSSDFSM